MKTEINLSETNQKKLAEWAGLISDVITDMVDSGIKNPQIEGTIELEYREFDIEFNIKSKIK